jgi:hypothetical protein
MRLSLNRLGDRARAKKRMEVMGDAAFHRQDGNDEGGLIKPIAVETEDLELLGVSKENVEYEAETPTKSSAAEKAKVKQAIMVKKAELHDLSEKLKRDKKELKRVRQMIEELSQEEEVKRNSTGQDPAMVLRVAELEQQLAQAKQENAQLIAAANADKDSQQCSIAERMRT